MLPKSPFYAKAAIFLVGLYFLVSILYIAQDIILPIVYAIIIATLLNPGVNFLVKKKINRVVSVGIIMLLALLIVCALIALLASQASMLSETFPQLVDKFQEMLNQVVTWSSGYFNISVRKINMWIDNEKAQLINRGSSAIGSTLTSVGSVLADVFLTPVYIFMILFYQPHLLQFVHKLFDTGKNNSVSEMLNDTKGIIQSYLVGLAAEFAIIAALNSIGLLILGIEYAILLGITGALLNVLPYVGGIIGVGIFMAIALATKAPVYVLYVFILYSVIQFIDNNYIVPRIVGSKVKLNALISIIAVVLGAALWGFSGMFLSIPIIAIIKLVFDRIESLKPWGFLLGDTTDGAETGKPAFTVKGFIQNINLKNN
ncbi:MAG: AI-2E family transporter [Bacteroidota bacterium]